MYTVDTVEFRKKMIDEGFDTFTDLAQKTGLCRETISAVANGRRKPSANVMEKLAMAMNMTPQDFGSIFFSPERA